MSPIGRVFILINLVLAGCFVGFAGTFLQRHTDYKTKFEDRTKELAQAETKYQGQITALNEDLRTKDRELRAATQNLGTANTDKQRLADENQRLQAQIAENDKNVAKLQSSYTTVASQIEQSVQQSKQAFQLAMEAVAAKNEALNAQQAAEANLSTANTRISTLEGNLADANGRIDKLGQEVREKEVLISMIERKFPGALALAQPDLKGVVSNVGPAGRIVTVRLTDNPGNAEIKPGYTMAIYQGDSVYKGEAVIEKVNGEFLFCRVTKLVKDARIATGDDAATNVGL